MGTLLCRLRANEALGFQCGNRQFEFVHLRAHVPRSRNNFMEIHTLAPWISEGVESKWFTLSTISDVREIKMASGAASVPTLAIPLSCWRRIARHFRLRAARTSLSESPTKIDRLRSSFQSCAAFSSKPVRGFLQPQLSSILCGQ